MPPVANYASRMSVRKTTGVFLAASLLLSAIPLNSRAETVLPSAPAEDAPSFVCGNTQMPLGVAMIRAARADTVTRAPHRASRPRTDRQALRTPRAAPRSEQQAAAAEPEAHLMRAIYACVATPTGAEELPRGTGPVRRT